MKRLKSRIDALEQQTSGGGGVSMPAKKMLVEILARRDALFWGWRWQLGNQPPVCELRIRQREYLAGVAGMSAKSSGLDWKAASATRSELIDSGMVTGIAAAGQVTSVIVTPLGDAVSRAMIGDRLSSGELGHMMMTHNGGPIREQFLLNHPCVGDPSGWDSLAEPLLPLLVQGVVRATSDTCGRIIYCRTDVDPIDAVQVDVAEEPWADDLYVAVFQHERRHLENVDPRDPSECFIPIGASDCWPKTESDTNEKS